MIHRDGTVLEEPVDRILADVQKMAQEGDTGGACQALLLCAAMQKRCQDLKAALGHVQEAWRLAESHHLDELSLWAAWATGALYACLKDFPQADESLGWLQAKLSEKKEWVLATFVELVRQALVGGEGDADQALLLRWLLRWGEPPARIEQGGQAPQAAEPGRESLLKKLLRALKGELRLAWVERGSPSDRPGQWSDQRPGLGPGQGPGFPTATAIPEKRSAPETRHPSESDLPGKVGKTGQPPEAAPAPASEPALGQPPAANRSEPSLSIYCLGPLFVYRDEDVIENWSSRKSQLVFKYLIAHRKQAISKDVLMSTFWPEADPEGARRNLHQAIYSLRQVLKTKDSNFQSILFENDGYRINPELNVWLDFEEFEQHARAGQLAERKGEAESAMTEYGIAEGLYRDHFLAEDLYEDWAQARRQALWEGYLTISNKLAQAYLARREYAAVIALGHRVLAFDNTQEEAHLALMKCYQAQGQRHMAITQYRSCVKALKESLGLAPSSEIQALYKQIARS